MGGLQAYIKVRGSSEEIGIKNRKGWEAAYAELEKHHPRPEDMVSWCTTMLKDHTYGDLILARCVAASLEVIVVGIFVSMAARFFEILISPTLVLQLHTSPAFSLFNYSFCPRLTHPGQSHAPHTVQGAD